MQSELAEHIARHGGCLRQRKQHRRRCMRGDQSEMRAREIVPREDGRMTWASDAAREVLQDLLRTGELPSRVLAVLGRLFGVGKRPGTTVELWLHDTLAVRILAGAAQRVHGPHRVARVLRVLATLSQNLEESLPRRATAQERRP